jgi:type 1 fimbriae regulatory protein FimB/type 1 fimbriae regulatory protein FimE
MEGKMLMAPNLRVVEPNNIYRKVPTRKPNAEMRTREYLTPAEVEKLIAAAKFGRYGQRDATLILVAFRHGLRAVEIADLEWSQVEWGRNPALHVRRAKNGKPAVHPSVCCASCNAIRRVLSSLRLNAAAHLRLTPSTAS